jgi:hypothetical protein
MSLLPEHELVFLSWFLPSALSATQDCQICPSLWLDRPVDDDPSSLLMLPPEKQQ